MIHSANFQSPHYIHKRDQEKQRTIPQILSGMVPNFFKNNLFLRDYFKRFHVKQ